MHTCLGRTIIMVMRYACVCFQTSCSLSHSLISPDQTIRIRPEEEEVRRKKEKKKTKIHKKQPIGLNFNTLEKPIYDRECQSVGKFRKKQSFRHIFTESETGVKNKTTFLRTALQTIRFRKRRKETTFLNFPTGPSSDRIPSVSIQN